MTLIKLAKPVEVPLYERFGYRAVQQRGAVIVMEKHEPDRDAERLAAAVWAEFVGANV